MKKFIKGLFKKKPVIENARLIQVNLDDEGVIERLHSIVKYSIENNIPVLVGNQEKIDLYKQYSLDIETFGFAKNFTKHVADTEFPNGVLVDETVTSEMVEVLRGLPIHIRGGFTSK